MVEPASAKDLEEICRLMDSAFETLAPHGHEISSEAESRLVRGLINDGDVLFSLVARSDLILGSVFVSRLRLVPDVGLRCAGIAPLAVLPKFQSSGIGTLLMQAAIRLSRKKKLDALFLLGDPAYYKRFGFTVSRIGSEYSSSHFQELALTEGCLSQLSCRAEYAAAFSEPPVE
jgi:putative acetyltransferase